MKTIPYIFMLIACFLIISCNPQNGKGTEGDAKEALSDVDHDQILRDFQNDQQELEKSLLTIKNSDIERNGHDYDAFEPEITTLEAQLDSLQLLVSTYATAPEMEKAEIHSEFREMKGKIKTGMEEIRERFNELKVLDT